MNDFNVVIDGSPLIVVFNCLSEFIIIRGAKYDIKKSNKILRQISTQAVGLK